MHPLDDPAVARAAEVLWRYHDLRHPETTTDVGIGLGGHDPSVADVVAGLHDRGRFPLVVFTGANAPTTRDRFPRGEAVHFRERALELGVPDAAVLVEDRAANTGENITRTRDLLAARGVAVRTVTLVSRPYQQRRAYATCRRQWPEVEPVCAAARVSLREHVAAIGDAARVLAMLVGDTVRIETYAARGFAIPQPMPEEVRTATELLISRGHTSRLP
ncbi:hypothetical protein BJF78_19645 [Pseudonocardia sp. CNS-139]|nr:hypothetical protein BJF78_19645 [Pseudonocardia sp. CNS-139]